MQQLAQKAAQRPLRHGDRGLSLHDRSERNTSADREFRKAADVGKRVAAVDKAIHIKASFAGLMKVKEESLRTADGDPQR